VPEPELRALLRIKNELGVFVDVRYKHDVPNYMPESVMQALEDRGLARDDIDGRR
jgi:hypothetical protein